MKLVFAVVFFFGLDGTVTVKSFPVPDPIEVCIVKAQEASSEAMKDPKALTTMKGIVARCVEVDVPEGNA